MRTVELKIPRLQFPQDMPESEVRKLMKSLLPQFQELVAGLATAIAEFDTYTVVTDPELLAAAEADFKIKLAEAIAQTPDLAPEMNAIASADMHIGKKSLLISHLYLNYLCSMIEEN